MDVLDMEITKTNLLKQLMNAITDDEWIELAQSRDLPISAFNRSVLLEMKTADANDGANAIQEAEVTGLHRVHRTSGNVEWSDDGFAHPHEANYNEAMTIYDVLCYSKEDCQLSWEFVNMKALSSIQSGSATVGGGLFQRTEKYFEQKSGLLSRACEKLGGIKYGKGDVGYQLQLFDFLPVVIQYWEADDEFPTILNLFADKNMLQYMHYETVWFAVGHLMARLREEMESMA